MRTLIIEDEWAAVSNLKAILSDIAPQCEVVETLDSIVESIKWLHENPMPELIFMDIHLADGSAFEVFDYVTITCPIIFTTAYDEYALSAFRVNSIDYLLKPIGEKEIKRAMDKLALLTSSPTPPQADTPPLVELIRSMQRPKQFRNYFLIPSKGSKLLPLPTESIYCFYIDNGVVKAITQANESFVIPHTLDDLSDSLHPQQFFRANRQFIIAKAAVVDIDYWFNGRLSINLKVDVKEKILVTKARVNEFKEWFSQGQ